MTTIKDEAKGLWQRLFNMCRWITFAVICGLVVGLLSVFVVNAIKFATEKREAFPWLIFFAPVAGIIIVFVYRVCGRDEDSGTNAVLEAIRSAKVIHLSTTPLIILATFLTHLVGGSSGREGAALQFGGSMGEAMGKLFKFSEKDRIVMIMCGMSAAFSAVFGLPISAAIFPMEVVSVGIMYYVALVPCTVASFTAHKVAVWCGIKSTSFELPKLSTMLVHNVAVTVVIAVLAAIVSITFCIMLHGTQHFAEKKVKNPYLRVAIGGAFIIVLTLLLGTDYNGMGMPVITQAVSEGIAKPEAFVIKMIFTTLTLSLGFKGGEIVPSFFIGATFGCVCGTLLGVSPQLCAAIGMICVFCGVTNCPIASIFIACEFFGFDYCEYFLVAIGITYVVSGYFGLYGSQMIMYSKTEPTFIHRHAE